MFSGSIPALVTPFRDGAFDEAAYRAFIDWQIDEGSSALVPCGTTGESATLSYDEHYEVIRVCIDQAAGRVPVIAGCGSNDTATAIRHMRFARDAGAAAALVVAPYYNRPGRAGIIAHFTALTQACDLPIIVYNVPARTVTDVTCDIMGELGHIPAIVGIKDATGDLRRVSEHRRLLGAGFCQLSGNDDVALGFMATGGAGCISVTANVAPRACARFQAACAAGDYATARALHDRLYPLHVALFADASPGPVKYALHRLRPDFADELRLPMAPPSVEARRQVDAALDALSGD